MTASSRWGMTPRQSIERECDQRGRSAVLDGCRALLRGEPVDAGLLLALGGPGAAKFLDGADRVDDYWLRVWGARGLLWLWDDSAEDEVRRGLGDEAWRVREMALKVVARHHVDVLLDDVVALRRDEVARVRQAADRALRILTSSGSSS